MTTNDHGVHVDLIAAGDRVSLVDEDGGHAFATVIRMDSPHKGIVELDDGTRAWFHVENVTRVMQS